MVPIERDGATAWTLHKPAINAASIGPRELFHLDEAVAALTYPVLAANMASNWQGRLHHGDGRIRRRRDFLRDSQF